MPPLSVSESEVAQSCLTLWDPIDCSLPGSSIHEILQALTLEWGAIFFSKGFSQPRDQTLASHVAGRFFAMWATREFPVDNINIKALFESTSLRPKRFRTTALLFSIYSKGLKSLGPCYKGKTLPTPTPAMIYCLLICISAWSPEDFCTW